MLRPAINKKTGAVDLINIETCANVNDYIIVGISKEANQDSMSLNGEGIQTESPTRKIALKQEEDYENARIQEALSKNISVNKVESKEENKPASKASKK